MAARPNWKGYLKLSLVSCPVALYNATTSSEKVTFHLLDRATGNRLRRQLVDPENGEVIDAEHQVHGYEVSKGDFITVEDEEIEGIALESTHTMDVDQFIPRAEVNDTYLDQPYYLVPDGEIGTQAFAVIREAMRKRRMAGIARLVLYRRERIVLLEPHGRGILATTLHYNYEIKPEADFFDDISDEALPDEMLDLAEHIIGTKTSHFDPSRFEDRYENAMLELIESKKAGKPLQPGKPQPAPSNVVDLMEALRRSVGDAPKPATATTKKTAKPAPATKPKVKAKTAKATAKPAHARKKAS